MSTIDYTAVRNEILRFVRNSDVLTVAERGVTTTTASGSLTAATSLLINVSNVKNIRSITIDAAPIVYGRDYTYNLDYNDSGTIKCRIAFTASTTGAYVVTYDYGTDKIFPDYPRSDLTIASFPRASIDISQTASDWGGFGGVLDSKVYFTVVFYGLGTDWVNAAVEAMRNAFITGYNDFYYFRTTRPVSIGPVVVSPREKTKDKVFQQNVDFVSEFNYERP